MVGDGENLKLIASAASKQVTTYNNNTALNTLHNALLQQLECTMSDAFNLLQRLLPRHSSVCYSAQQQACLHVCCESCIIQQLCDALLGVRKHRLPLFTALTAAGAVVHARLTMVNACTHVYGMLCTRFHNQSLCTHACLLTLLYSFLIIKAVHDCMCVVNACANFINVLYSLSQHAVNFLRSCRCTDVAVLVIHALNAVCR
jgi:hypothetical protein